ncbi:MAG: hypothetical protein NDP13_02555 [Crenarchaeota archaeon]|nr:hypothetical protein [Thermoproteota archaeon]MCR8453850.1 hypothetical protein [Thermoproteota archaeon]MCR8455331.1 hypothetical protein [Thermoproteota archaeon]MCR8462601.1 hypothetical protein [Thermoproteota archaeon]MCR8472372.1 hypothetical protein [Thermoproteota archaeon]
MDTTNVLEEIEIEVRIKSTEEYTNTINIATLPESNVEFEDLYLKQLARGNEVALQVKTKRRPVDRILTLLRTVDDFLVAVGLVLSSLKIVKEDSTCQVNRTQENTNLEAFKQT